MKAKLFIDRLSHQCLCLLLGGLYSSYSGMDLKGFIVMSSVYTGYNLTMLIIGLRIIKSK